MDPAVLQRLFLVDLLLRCGRLPGGEDIGRNQVLTASSPMDQRSLAPELTLRWNVKNLPFPLCFTVYYKYNVWTAWNWLLVLSWGGFKSQISLQYNCFLHRNQKKKKKKKKSDLQDTELQHVLWAQSHDLFLSPSAPLSSTTWLHGVWLCCCVSREWPCSTTRPSLSKTLCCSCRFDKRNRSTQ